MTYTAIQALIEMYEKIEDELIVNICKNLKPGTGEVSDIAAWQLKKLNDLGALRQANLKVIAQYTNHTVEQIAQIISETGYKALQVDEAMYQAAFRQGLLAQDGVVPFPLKSSPYLQQTIQAAIGNATDYFNLINSTAAQSATTAFSTIVNQSYLEVSMGVKDLNHAVADAARGLADKGITAVTYTSAKGRIINVPTDVAVRRGITTSTSQTAGKLQLQRAREWGANLVEVTSHMGARPDHEVWQGKIYSIDGGTAKYPNLAQATGYGTPKGLKGPGCRHDFYPFIEGLDEQTYHPYPKGANDKAYAESQQQRGFERAIREQKRRIIAADAVGDEAGAQAARRALGDKKGELKAFLAETGRTNRTARQYVEGFVH